jgi:nucleoside 2-deoxyribosyltransferase
MACHNRGGRWCGWGLRGPLRRASWRVVGGRCAVKIYLAGPYGFSEAGRAFLYGTLVPRLEQAGAVVLDPWKLTDAALFSATAAMPAGEARVAAWRALNAVIGGNNVSAIEACDLVVAVLDGADVDSGTAAEIGFAYGRGKRVLGYRGDFRLTADNEGAIVNLQVEYFIRASGGAIFLTMEALAAEVTRRSK